MAWERKTPAGGDAVPPPRSPGGLNPSMHLQFRASSLIRLFSILAGALLVGIGVQGADRFGAPWLPYVTVPAALLVIAWAIGYQVWAYDGRIEVRTAFGMRTIELAGTETIVLLKMGALLGQTRGVAAFVGSEQPVRHFTNSMLSAPDFARLLEWTGVNVVPIEGVWTPAKLGATHPELLEEHRPPNEPQWVWTAISLVTAALFVGAFFFFARRGL